MEGGEGEGMIAWRWEIKMIGKANERREGEGGTERPMALKEDWISQEGRGGN